MLAHDRATYLERIRRALLSSYPEQISHVTKEALIWKDGTNMPLHERVKSKDPVVTAQSSTQLLSDLTLFEQFLTPYAEGPYYTHKEYRESGRIRYLPFFKKMYGHTEEEVAKNLVEIVQLPKTFGNQYKLKVTKINGVAEKLQQVSCALDTLPQRYKDYLKNPGGTFNWRFIAGTD